MLGNGLLKTWTLNYPTSPAAGGGGSGATGGDVFSLFPFANGKTLVTWFGPAEARFSVLVAGNYSGLPPFVNVPGSGPVPSVLLLSGRLDWDSAYEALVPSLLPAAQQTVLTHLPTPIAAMNAATSGGAVGTGVVIESAKHFFRIHRMETDADGDGLDWAAEIFQYGTDPDNADSDGDGMSDAAELAAGHSPTLSEVAHRLHVLVPDRENDVLLDLNDGNVELHWDAPADNTVQHLCVEWSKDGGPWVVRGTYPVNVTQHTENGLESLVGFRFRVVSLYSSSPELASMSVDYEVPFLKRIEVRNVWSTYNYPSDFLPRSGPQIKYRDFTSTYDSTEVSDGVTKVTSWSYNHHLDTDPAVEAAYGSGTVTADGTPAAQWSDEYSETNPHFGTAAFAPAYHTHGHSSAPLPLPAYDVEHELSFNLVRGVPPVFAGEGYPKTWGIIPTDSGPAFLPTRGPILSLLKNGWSPGNETETDSDGSGYSFTMTSTETYSDPLLTADMIVLTEKNLQPFDANWDAPFWGWIFSRFTTFGGYRWNGGFSYKYVKGAGFASFTPETWPVDVTVAWRNLIESGTWYSVTRGQVRVVVNPPAVDAHMLLLHRFSPEPPPDPDPEDNIPGPPGDPPEYRLLDFAVTAHEGISSTQTIDPLSPLGLGTNRDGEHAVSLLPVDLVIGIPKEDDDTTTTSTLTSGTGLAAAPPPPISNLATGADIAFDIENNLVPADKEDTEGGWAVLNLDDDDNDGGSWAHAQNIVHPDLADANGVTGENDLIILGIKEVAVPGITYRLKFDNTNVRLWKVRQKGAATQEVISEQTEFTIPPGGKWKQVFLEGIKPHDDDKGTIITEQIRVGATGQWTDADTVKVRVAQPILAFFGEGNLWQSDYDTLVQMAKNRAGTDPTRNRNTLFNDTDKIKETYFMPGKTQAGKDVCYSLSTVWGLRAAQIAKIALALKDTNIVMTGHANWGVGMAFGKNFSSYEQFFSMAGGTTPAVSLEGFHEHDALTIYGGPLTLRPGAIAQLNGHLAANPANRVIAGIPLPNIDRYPNDEAPVVAPGTAFAQRNIVELLPVGGNVQTYNIRWNFLPADNWDKDEAGDKRTVLQIATDVPAALQYRSLFLNQCSSFRYSIESFKHGDVVTAWQAISNPSLAKDYSEGVMDGLTWAQIETKLEQRDPPTPGKFRPRSSFDLTSFP